MLVGGPTMAGRHKVDRLAACTDCRRFWGSYRAGTTDDAEINQVEGRLAVTAGTCAVMGTASTMALIGETLGMMLPGTAAIPAVHADRLRASAETGALAAEMAISGVVTPDQLIPKPSIENCLLYTSNAAYDP